MFRHRPNLYSRATYGIHVLVTGVWAIFLIAGCSSASSSNTNGGNQAASPATANPPSITTASCDYATTLRELQLLQSWTHLSSLTEGHPITSPEELAASLGTSKEGLHKAFTDICGDSFFQHYVATYEQRKNDVPQMPTEKYPINGQLWSPADMSPQAPAFGSFVAYCKHPHDDVTIRSFAEESNNSVADAKAGLEKLYDDACPDGSHP
jgi:hypothetical protein